MNRVERLTLDAGRNVVLVSGILGLEADEAVAQRAFEESNPDLVLLGVPFEDLDSIRATSGAEATAEFERGDLDDEYLKRLAKFGTVRAPPPDLYALFRSADARKVPIQAIDLGDEAYTKTYTDNVGFFEVMRSTRGQKKIPSLEIEAGSVEEFARRWDETLYPTKGLRKLQTAREETMAKHILDAAKRYRSIVALVPLARAPGVRARLVGAGAKPGS